MTSMEIAEGRELGAEAVPGNDEEVETAVADRGYGQGRGLI